MRRLVRLAFGFLAAVTLASSAMVPQSAEAASPIQVVIRLRLPVSELSKVPVGDRGSFIICDGQMSVNYTEDGTIDSEQRVRDSLLGTTSRTLECLIRFRGVAYQRRQNLSYDIPVWGFQFFDIISGRPVLVGNRFRGVDTLTIIVPGTPLRGKTLTYVIGIVIINGRAVLSS